MPFNQMCLYSAKLVSSLYAFDNNLCGFDRQMNSGSFHFRTNLMNMLLWKQKQVTFWAGWKHKTIIGAMWKQMNCSTLFAGPTFFTSYVCSSNSDYWIGHSRSLSLSKLQIHIHRQITWRTWKVVHSKISASGRSNTIEPQWNDRVSIINWC